MEANQQPKGKQVDPTMHSAEHILTATLLEYDACPRTGPLVRSTKDIGAFRIVSASFADGTLFIGAQPSGCSKLSDDVGFRLRRHTGTTWLI